MAKNKILKILGGTVVICLLFFGSAFGTFKIIEAKNFNDLVTLANEKFNTGNYDEAIVLYEKALSYKDDRSVEKEIMLAKNYKQCNGIYNEGIKLMNDKKYSGAMQKLSTIKQSSGLIYTNAQSKIEECKKNIISENINATNTAISNKDYNSANKYIEEILKIDINSNDAKQLKATITQVQQKDKEEAEQRRIAEQNKIQQNKVQQNSSQAPQRNNNKTVQSNSNTQQASIDEQMEYLDYLIERSPKGSQERRDLMLQQIKLLQQK